MAAKDYQICPALTNAYIAKVSKRNPNMMLDDRRVITESEILTLIDWFLDRQISLCPNEEEPPFIFFESDERPGQWVQLKFLKERPKEMK